MPGRFGRLVKPSAGPAHGELSSRTSPSALDPSSRRSGADRPPEDPAARSLEDPVARDDEAASDAEAAQESPTELDAGWDGFGLDPLERALWQPTLGAPEARAPVRVSPPAMPLAAPPLDALVDRFVKRFAMSGDRNRGTAHLAIGGGELAGGAVTVRAEGGAVTIVVDAPPGVSGEAFGARLGERLRARGIDATIEVR